MLNRAGQGAALGQWPCDLDEVAAGWRPLLQAFLASAEGRRLSEGLRARLAAGATIYPPQPLRALQLTPPEAVRAVILGQDPYHGPGQACGLAFAVAPGVRPPPSLRNIFKELAREFGRPPQTEQHALAHWARQGVLLLNTSLTVEAGQAASHARIGWQVLTSQIFHRLVHGPRPLAFLLWGNYAQKKGAVIDSRRHRVLKAPHPSPLSAHRGFLGCGHFSAANQYLTRCGKTPIDWTLPPRALLTTT